MYNCKRDFEADVANSLDQHSQLGPIGDFKSPSQTAGNSPAFMGHLLGVRL